MLKIVREANPDLTVFGCDDIAFERYGRRLDPKPWADLAEKVAQKVDPGADPIYLASVPELEQGGDHSPVIQEVYREEEAQVGICRGYNNAMNGMEWHDCSEIIVAVTPLILLLGRSDEIQNGMWNSGNTEACFLGEGEVVELYQGTLHFAPSRIASNPFLSIIVLPRRVNDDLPEMDQGGDRDPRLLAHRKWLISHPESPQASNGAFVGIIGDNIRVNTI